MLAPPSESVKSKWTQSHQTKPAQLHVKSWIFIWPICVRNHLRFMSVLGFVFFFCSCGWPWIKYVRWIKYNAGLLIAQIWLSNECRCRKSWSEGEAVQTRAGVSAGWTLAWLRLWIVLSGFISAVMDRRRSHSVSLPLHVEAPSCSELKWCVSQDLKIL